MSLYLNTASFVIPAKEGIHLLPLKFTPQVMAPRLRGGDEVLKGRGAA